MPYYSVSRKESADAGHLVHAKGCSQYPNELTAQALGWHVYCSTAIKAAAEFFVEVDGCERCCWPCHKGHWRSERPLAEPLG